MNRADQSPPAAAHLQGPATQTPVPPPETHDSAGGSHEPEPLPLDTVSPQFTVRAVLTGMFLGAVLSMCNIYTGLKIGWSFNMSITAALLSYAFWMSLSRLFGTRPWGILENNINQTACSSGASVSSAGLVAPIPALAMLTGQTLTWHYLALWVFSVCMVGITLAIALRRQMLLVDKLPFALGIASAETLREMYARGSEAIRRAMVLLSSAVVAALLYLLTQYQWQTKIPGLAWFKLEKWAPEGVAVGGFKAKSLTFSLDPSLLMVGVGGIIGLRACVSLVVGAVLAYAVVAPWLLHTGHMRLTVREPLIFLPAGVEFEPEPRSFASYDDGNHTLVYKGVMTPEQRDELLAKSDDPLYQQAVLKLFFASQLHPTDEQAAAEAALVTTRYVRFSTPLAALPDCELPMIPRKFAHVVRFDAAGGKLTAIGLMSDEARALMLKRAALAQTYEPSLLEQWTPDWLAKPQPPQAERIAAFRNAVNELYERSRRPLIDTAGRDVVELAGGVVYDARNQRLSVTGKLAPDDKQALAAVSDNPDFTASLALLTAGTSLRRADANFGDMNKWLLWPGVTLMVVASLVSFSFSWRSVLSAVPFGGSKFDGDAGRPQRSPHEVTAAWFATGLIVALIVSVALQVSFFAIAWWAAVLGVLLSFVLALVAARVSGETSITPVGPMGKVTQLVFGVLVPQNPAPNLMAANVTGGAASQCADLLHDLKTGQLIGASPRLQSVAQIFGALAGSLVGSAVYLIMIPNPKEQLLTEEWPAIAVAAWKAVAEVFQVGLSALPSGTVTAMAIAAALGVALPVAEKLIPRRARWVVPSAASLGLAFVIPAYNGVSIFLGGLAAAVFAGASPSLAKRFLVACCAGLVAGESLSGVGVSIQKIIGG